jgi:hypothetical protein
MNAIVHFRSGRLFHADVSADVGDKTPEEVATMLCSANSETKYIRMGGSLIFLREVELIEFKPSQTTALGEKP